MLYTYARCEKRAGKNGMKIWNLLLKPVCVIYFENEWWLHRLQEVKM